MWQIVTYIYILIKQRHIFRKKKLPVTQKQQQQKHRGENKNVGKKEEIRNKNIKYYYYL